VPESQDSVRKAIAEARGRLRERQANVESEAAEPEPAPVSVAREIPPPSFDGDEMDID
jgi:hypothetical protein